MPVSTTRTERLEAIVDLVRSHRVDSQAELLTLLARRGHAVNQGTLSRDLRELRVRKGPEGYELPEHRRPDSPTGALEHAAREWLIDANPAQNIAVLRTPPGGASALALALDGAPPEGCVGTIAGDDTVFVACKDTAAASRVCRELQRLRGDRP